MMFDDGVWFVYIRSLFQNPFFCITGDEVWDRLVVHNFLHAQLFSFEQHCLRGILAFAYLALPWEDLGNAGFRKYGCLYHNLAGV